jgi:DDE superfamily endonuclease
LINDGLATHKSLELMTYCFKNNIVLCRLPSHSSYKLQPLDVSVFGPLKTAYRDQVERLYRGGANTVGKQHTTRLYSRSRDAAFTARNIRAGWVKTGLHPFNPDRVLQEIQKPPTEESLVHVKNVASGLLSPHSLLPTPVNAEGFETVRKELEQASQHLDAAGKHRLQKLANAGERAIADRVLLVEENRILFDQNNEKMSRSSTKSTVVGTARIMSYDDIMEAQRKREAKKPGASRAFKRNQKHSNLETLEEIERCRMTEVEKGNHEIENLGLRDFYSVLQF